jgi:hypothetical protein
MGWKGSVGWTDRMMGGVFIDSCSLYRSHFDFDRNTKL